MSTKTITVCDGCGKELRYTKERYTIDLKTSRYRECAEDDLFYDVIELEFCDTCAEFRLLPTLEKLAKKVKVGD
jgi:hypothetical protein